MKPQARQIGLLVRELADEVVVYDQQRHTAHCLNRTAALVFRNADGRRTRAELSALPGLNAEVVEIALAQLAASGLLERRKAGSAPGSGVSRREAARRVGLAAAIVLPAVITVVAPTPAEAAATCVSSCVGQPDGTRCDVCLGGTSCATSTNQCVSGTCTDGCPG
jgi:hypothetical protein